VSTSVPIFRWPRMCGQPHAVVLFGGWLLMFPPCAGQGEKLECDTRAPLTASRTTSFWERLTGHTRQVWEHTASFDTARECERARQKGLRKAADVPEQKDDPTRAPSQIDRVMRLAYSRFQYARCIPAEHVYPP
jgi:hypothetical protein